MDKQKSNMEQKCGKNVFIQGHKCYRCGHEWKPRDLNDVPEVCPNCKSPYWQTAKKIFNKGEKKK